MILNIAMNGINNTTINRNREAIKSLPIHTNISNNTRIKPYDI
jgi:hypothetical protein